jgi:dihydrofolate reductase
MVKSIIVAKAYNQVIGYKQQLPWHLPNDLSYFKQLTLGHHVILGRKTFESLPKSLPGRILIIITRNLKYKAAGCYIAFSLQEALKIAEKSGETEVFIAGGGKLYQEALPITDQVYAYDFVKLIRHAGP